jgi:hypothetical protein
MKNDTELLESRVKKQTMKIRLKQKERYQLAKTLGFSASEAVVLQNWSADRIRAVAGAKPKAL